MESELNIMLRENQGEALKTVNLTGRREVVWRALSGKPYQTRRQLSDATGYEISGLCAALKSLEKDQIIHVPFSAECPQTGKMVAVYDLLNLQEEVHADDAQ